MGPSVNLAARLMGKAKPWQVLVEECVHDKALSVETTWRFTSHAAVNAKGYDEDFPMLALVNIVNTQKIATYAEAKQAVTQLQDSRFFRLFRGTQRGNPSCAWAVDEVHQWVLALVQP